MGKKLPNLCDGNAFAKVDILNQVQNLDALVKWLLECFAS